METIKLSEVLSRLNKTESLATDGIIVSRNGGTFRTQTKDLPKATTSQAGIMGVKDKSYLETLKTWSIGSLNEFAKAGEFTMPEFNAFLNGLNYKGTNKKELKSGRYLANVGGVPLFVTFVVLHAASKKSAIWVEGCLMVTNTQISLNSEKGVTIAYRTCVDATWSDWKTILDDLKSEVPTVQSSASGSNKNYIYSNGVTNDKNCVASCNWWIYSEDGRIYVRWKKWGADDNTHYDHDNESHQTLQYMIPYMGSDGGACYQDGLLPWQWGQRMKDCGEKFRFIEEDRSTTEYVNLRYLNFSNGGRYDTPISKATTAKAGVMTAADKTYIETLKPWLRDSLGSFDSSEAFNTYLNGLSYDDMKDKGGRYVVYLGGVPFFVTFSVLYAKEQILAIWVEGSLMVTDNVISSNTSKGVTIAYRYYKNGAWESWKTIYDDLNGVVAGLKANIVALEDRIKALEAKHK